MMTNWNALIPDAPFDWALIPLDGHKRPIDPETGDLKTDWQLQDGYDIDGISALNGQVHAVGLMLGEKSGGVLQVDYDGPASPAKFQEIYGKSPKDLPRTIGVTSGKESRGSRFFLVDPDWWDSLRGAKSWKDENGDICLELRWAGHQAVIAGKHPETSGYRWMANSSPADLEMATAPDWLLEPLIRTEATYEPVQVSAEDAQRAIEMLQCIDPNSRTNYDGWLEIGMALHHTDEGLLSDWIAWSKQMSNFDKAECLQKWQGFADYKGQPLTIGTLHHFAKQGGYVEPKRQPVTKPQGGVQGDLELMGWSDLLDYILKSIRQNSPDHEMKARAELKNRFRISDEQLNTALFKRHGEGRLLNVKPAHDSVSMAKVETLQYQLDGWIQKGDVGLLYGAYGTGKTTLALWKAYHLAKGINILDRNTPCTPARSLIIATDSGLGPLKKSLEDLGLDPDNDPLFQPGHPDQMIYIWGYDPAQGHGSWICDIQGIIRLEQFIELKNIAYVAIDSAKSVSSVAGWSYTSNESVKALLKHLREVVATPTDSFIEFLSHDGTEKGMHSGAKAWAEDPSLVCRLELQKDEATGQESVRCEFKKDRAAAVDPRRKLTYFLEDCQLKLAPEVEVVSTCEDAIVEVLWSAHQNNVPSVKTNELKSEVYARFRKTSKTVENTLPRINKKRIVSPRRGSWYLSPSEIQRLEAKHSSSNRDPYVMGRVNSKPTASVDVCLPPDPVLTSGVRGVRNIPKPPISPRGGRSGGSETLVAHNVLTFTPPVEGRANPKTNSDLSDWMQDDEEII